MKKKRWVLLFIILALLSPAFYQIVMWQIYLADPDIVKHTRATYQKLTTNDLISRLSISNFMWYELAIETLAERGEASALPYIINLTNSPIKGRRHPAIRALARFNNSESENALIAVVTKNKDEADHQLALFSLSQMRSDVGYPYILLWAKRENAYANGAIYMLENYRRPDSLPILASIREQVKLHNPGFEFKVDEVEALIKSQTSE